MADRKALLELVDAYAAAVEEWQKTDRALQTATAKEQAARMKLDDARLNLDSVIGGK